MKREFVHNAIQGEDATKIWQDVLDCLDNGRDFAGAPPSVRKVRQIKRLANKGGEAKWNSLVTFLTWAIYAEAASECEESEWRYVEEVLSGAGVAPSGTSPADQLSDFARHMRGEITSGQRGLGEIATVLRSQSSQHLAYDQLLAQAPDYFSDGYLKKVAAPGISEKLEDYLTRVFLGLAEQDLEDCDDMIQFFQLYEGKLLDRLIEPSSQLTTGEYKPLELIEGAYDIDAVKEWITAWQEHHKQLTREIVDKDKLEDTPYGDLGKMLEQMEKAGRPTLGALVVAAEELKQGSGGKRRSQFA